MKKIVYDSLVQSLSKMGIENPPKIEIEFPKDEGHGDLSSPVAMSLARVMKKPPIKIAQELLVHMEGKDAFEKIEIAGPGFINFTFKRAYLFESLKSLLTANKDFLRQDIGRGTKILVEFVSANPTGPLHVGHGRGAAFGAALCNLLDAGGFDVMREYYVNDAGRQIGMLSESVFAKYNERLGIEYAFPQEGYRGGYVEDIAQEIIKAEGERFKDYSYVDARAFFSDFSLNMMLKEIKRDLQDFGVRFDNWQSERALYESGEVDRCMDYLRHKGLLYESEDALWFRATAFGDEKDRVVVKSGGEHTYFASDIAYHLKKFQMGYSELINILGADHHGYVPRLKAVVEALGHNRESLTVLLVQMVSLQRGGSPVQMSKRSGDFISLREVMDEVGADTTKFAFLTRRQDSHLKFDLDSAKEQSSENPVFYVQYANARINSIFKKAQEQGIIAQDADSDNLRLLNADEELKIIKKLLAYPIVFEAAVLSREPHRITFYLQELSTLFHQFYNTQRVVGEDIALASARMHLCQAVRIVLREGLSILGLSAPESM